MYYISTRVIPGLSLFFCFRTGSFLTSSKSICTALGFRIIITHVSKAFRISYNDLSLVRTFHAENDFR